METPRWVEKLFQSIDTMDADAFAAFLTDDAQFRYANAPPVIGKAAIREAVAGFFGTINGLRHRLVRTWAHADSIICEIEVTYTRKDNRKVVVPAATIFYTKGDKVRTYLVFNDLTPVYAPSA